MNAQDNIKINIKNKRITPSHYTARLLVRYVLSMSLCLALVTCVGHSHILHQQQHNVV